MANSRNLSPSVFHLPKPCPTWASLHTPAATPTWRFQPPTGMSISAAETLATACCSSSYKRSLNSLSRRILLEVCWTSITLSAQHSRWLCQQNTGSCLGWLLCRIEEPEFAVLALEDVGLVGYKATQPSVFLHTTDVDSLPRQRHTNFCLFIFRLSNKEIFHGSPTDSLHIKLWESVSIIRESLFCTDFMILIFMGAIRIPILLQHGDPFGKIGCTDSERPLIWQPVSSGFRVPTFQVATLSFVISFFLVFFLVFFV